MNHTIFDDIVTGKMKSWKIWEDEKFLGIIRAITYFLWMTIYIPK